MTSRRTVVGALAASALPVSLFARPIGGRPGRSRQPQAAATAAPEAPVVGPEVNVVTLGADASGANNSTDAFQAAAKQIQAAGGGRLIIPAGRYRVGRQSFAGAHGRGHAFLGEDIVAIRNCTTPVEILADGATMYMTGGLRFGSFDPQSGQAFEPPKMPFVDTDYLASIGSFFNFIDNADVRLVGLVGLDGSIEKQTIGGRWGDTGRQVAAYGVRAYNNRAFSLRGLRSRGQGLDDLVIGWQGLAADAPSYPHVVTDVQGLGAGRNGFSWVGGNSLTMTDCRFEKAGGRAGGPVASSPGAGIDIEAENAVCRNGLFQRVVCTDNHGVALIADSGDSADSRFEDCQFVGTDNWSVWPRKPRMRFERCLFVGPMVNLYGSPKTGEATQFIDCTNTLDPARSPTGALYGYGTDFSSGNGALWQGGMIDLAGKSGLATAGGPTGMRWKDTRITGKSSGGLYVKGVFQGNVTIDYPNGLWDPAGGAIIEGTVNLHDRRTTGPETIVLHGPARR